MAEGKQIVSELEIEKSKVAQLTTQCVLLRGEIVTLKEKLAASRRRPAGWTGREFEDDRTQAEIDREEKGEHEADLERSGH